MAAFEDPLERVMGCILKFESRGDHGRRREPDEAGISHHCQIIILPCVRYERWENAAVTPAPQKKKARKRRARAV